jgi:hypothetical protein
MQVKEFQENLHLGEGLPLDRCAPPVLVSREFPIWRQCRSRRKALEVTSLLKGVTHEIDRSDICRSDLHSLARRSRN